MMQVMKNIKLLSTNVHTTHSTASISRNWRKISNSSLTGRLITVFHSFAVPSPPLIMIQNTNLSSTGLKSKTHKLLTTHGCKNDSISQPKKLFTLPTFSKFSFSCKFSTRLTPKRSSLERSTYSKESSITCFSYGSQSSLSSSK